MAAKKNHSRRRNVNISSWIAFFGILLLCVVLGWIVLSPGILIFQRLNLKYLVYIPPLIVLVLLYIHIGFKPQLLSNKRFSKQLKKWLNPWITVAFSISAFALFSCFVLANKVLPGSYQYSGTVQQYAPVNEMFWNNTVLSDIVCTSSDFSVAVENNTLHCEFRVVRNKPDVWVGAIGTLPEQINTQDNKQMLSITRFQDRLNTTSFYISIPDRTKHEFYIYIIDQNDSFVGFYQWRGFQVDSATALATETQNRTTVYSLLSLGSVLSISSIFIGLYHLRKLVNEKS